jgi:hypothetical protein
MPASPQNKKINLTKDRAQIEIANESIPSEVGSFYRIIKKFQFWDTFFCLFKFKPI